MAHGRMISKKIGCSKQVHDLSSDTCRLAFTWTIPHLDKEGRIHGDPSILRSLVFPRRTDISPDIMQGFINEWAIQGLVQLYEVQGDTYIYFPTFRENQPGLRSDKEPDSCLPSPEEGRQIDGKVPSKVRKSSVKVTSQWNGMEGKRREGKIAADAAVTETSFYQRVWKGFLSKNGDKFTDYGKEGKATHGLIAKAEARDKEHAEDLLISVCAAFWKLKCGTDKFWQGQPFLPSALNSSSIWDRVIETMRSQETVADPIALAVARGEMK
jgi:hypothetical protein